MVYCGNNCSERTKVGDVLNSTLLLSCIPRSTCVFLLVGRTLLLLLLLLLLSAVQAPFVGYSAKKSSSGRRIVLSLSLSRLSGNLHLFFLSCPAYNFLEGRRATVRTLSSQSGLVYADTKRASTS